VLDAAESLGLRESSVRVWPVGSLLKAIADSLEARFNPVAVQGEIFSFSRAASGHCYFSLKDSAGLDGGQIRCAMFRRTSSLLDFTPRDGQRVELRGRLGVYEARGELQLVVESMRQAGQGTLFEEFLKLKARLEAQGLFDSARKRSVPLMPKVIGIVTSLGAAALHDVVTALQRRVPHIPVIIYPASVQGAQAAGELRDALLKAYQRNEVDVLLLVRGGGAMEDLWAFNDESLARIVAASPVPIICGVGHETDFTIADFCADLRAPTPTAAAELCAQPQAAWQSLLDAMASRLDNGVNRQLQTSNQRLDIAVSRFGRPSHYITRQQARLTLHGQNLQYAERTGLSLAHNRLDLLEARFKQSVQRSTKLPNDRLHNARVRLDLLNPAQVLKRGYAWLSTLEGQAVTSITQTLTGQALRASLMDGEVDLTVASPRLI
jgi:exodeoxyribonuclease VII large subunit